MAPPKLTFTVSRGAIADTLTFDGRIVPVQQKICSSRLTAGCAKFTCRKATWSKPAKLLADLNVVDGLESGQHSKELSLRRAQINVDMAQNRRTRLA